MRSECAFARTGVPRSTDGNENDCSSKTTARGFTVSSSGRIAKARGIQRVQVAVVGAGLSGLCMAWRLRQASVKSFVVLEKADRVGGTWRDNIYPGVACDVPSHLYSYSFAPKPNWSRIFAPGEEIQEYCESVAKNPAIEPYLEFGAEVHQASFQDGRWNINLVDGRRVQSDVLVCALGALHLPNIPAFEGLESFQGELFHSARWPHDHQWEGKRIGVIGSGASAIQIVPAIADEAKHLSVFQRSPAWIVPRRDRAYPSWAQWLLQIPGAANLPRWFYYWYLEARGRFARPGSSMAKSLEERALKHLRWHIQDPDLRQALTPDYTIGCKRILLSDDYYATLARPDVKLVSRPIERITPSGIQLADGKQYPLDVIVAATGFRPFSIEQYIQMQGRDGRTLAAAWEDKVLAHRTVMVPGFPNMFLLLGPNSGLAHNSVILMIESQVQYILKCLRMLKRLKKSSLEPLPQAVSKYQQELDRAMHQSVFSEGCNSWYTDKNNHNYTLWPRTTLRYFWEMWWPKASEFQWHD